MATQQKTNKGTPATAQAAPEAVPTATITPRLQAVLDHTRDADQDGNILTAASINELSKGLAADEEYEGEVFTLADFDELVKRGLLMLLDGEYHLPLTGMDLTPVESKLITTLREGSLYGVLDYLMAIQAGKSTLDAPAVPKEPKHEVISFRAPDPAHPYGYDYGDSIMPHELIAMSIVHDLAFFTDLPRRFTVADGECASDFLGTIIASMESAFQTIEAIELAQLIVAIQRDKSRNQ